MSINEMRISFLKGNALYEEGELFEAWIAFVTAKQLAHSYLSEDQQREVDTTLVALRIYTIASSSCLVCEINTKRDLSHIDLKRLKFLHTDGIKIENALKKLKGISQQSEKSRFDWLIARNLKCLKKIAAALLDQSS